MIQLQFSSAKHVVHSLPLVPSSSATSSSANIPTAPILRINNHRRRGQFTAKIIKHGGTTRDTSIHAASKSKQREKIQYEKSIGSLDEMMEEFEKEREEIHKLQETIMKNEKILAKTLLKWYAVLSIQMKWRSYYSKRILLRLKAARFITRWAKFRHYYRKLCRAASVINRRVKTLMARRRYLKFIKYHRAAKIIQRNIRKKLDWFHWLFSIFKLSRMKRFIDHIILFGGRRAIKFITDGTKKQQEARIVGKAFLRSIARRKRLKMLRGPQGKIAFYVLSRFYVSNSAIPHNKVMEYLRRRVLTQEDKTRRRVNLSMKQVSELNMKSKTGNKGKQQASPKQGGGGYLSPIQQQQERQQQQQLLQQQQQQEQYYQSQAALFTINDLPPYFHGIYAPRGVADVMLLIQDLYQVALQNPTYLDDSIVPTHPSSSTAPTATSPGGRKGRQREGQMANPKHLLSVASAASTTLSSNSGSGKMKGIGRSTSSEEQGEVITARTSLTGPSPSTSIRHPTTYNQASSVGNHPKNKFVKKDTMVAHHGSSNHSEITSHLASFTPAPPNSTRNTEIGRSPRGRLTGAISNRTPILRGSTASEGMRSMIMDIVEDDEDETPKTVKRNESINTDTSDEDEEESKKGTIGSRSGSPKDQFDTEKPLQMGKSFTAKIKHDNLGNTPMTTPRTTQLDGNSKGHGSFNKQSTKNTNNSTSNTTTKRQSVLQKDHHQGNSSKLSNAGTSQKRMSKPVNKPTAAIIANIPPLSLMTPKTDSNDEDQLRFPAIRTPPLNPLLHPGESASSPLNSWATSENVELMNDTPLVQVPMLNTLNSTMSSTLVYSESEDESSPFKDMKGKKFSNSFLPAPNALFAVTDSLPVENSVNGLSSLPNDDSKEAEKDDFVSDVLSPSGTSLLQFDIPETTMVELLGTGYHLEGKE